MTLKISIIVPVYNAEKYLDRCMESIYAQTLTEYEIILVNDGSKDNSLSLCQKYAQKDARIKVIDKENGGAGSARNAGIEVANGEYLAFPDADDWFEKEMYQELYDLAKSGDYDIVFSGVNYYQQGKNGEMCYSRSANCKSLYYTTQKECRENVMKLFPTTIIFDSPCNKLYKRSLVQKHKVCFRDLRRCQDAVFNLDVYDKANRLLAVDKAYYNYMENTQADVWRKFPRNYIDINIFYYTHLKKLMTDWGVYEGQVKEHYDTSFVLAIYGTLEMFDNPNWGMNRQEQKEYVREIMARDSVQTFLKDSLIRGDARGKFQIISEQDVKAFFKKSKQTRCKEKISASFIGGFYRRVRRRIKGKLQ